MLGVGVVFQLLHGRPVVPLGRFGLERDFGDAIVAWHLLHHALGNVHEPPNGVGIIVDLEHVVIVDDVDVLYVTGKAR